MNWLQDNPFGRALVYVSGGLLLLVVIMTVVWSLPVSVDTDGIEPDENEGPAAIEVAHEIASLKDLQIINEKPLFNENRLPEIAEINDEDVVEDTTIAVKDAPDVKLTGVIITPEMKIATLTPSDAELKNVMAHEGQALVGEYVGWKVGTVNPRAVVLVSNDGRQLGLELQVHDTAIKQPPKPVVAAADPPATAVQDEAGQAEPPMGEDGQPLSRAEQIRQRIAERREELRREQEARAAEAQPAPTKAGTDGTANRRSSYQNAIRNMMNNSRKDKDSNDEKDG
ncbi:MAG: hypothetical protein OQJ84_06070 [Xanthomonadales bacterium]|nr:hypothetical protein [Xanthomonadales bacterium]